MINNGLDIWEVFMSYLGNAFSFMRPLLPAAFLGSIMHIGFNKDRRRKSKWFWIKSIIWSTIAGAGVMPTVMYYLDLPLQIANSVTFFVTLCGIEFIDSMIFGVKNKAISTMVDKVTPSDNK